MMFLVFSLPLQSSLMLTVTVNDVAGFTTFVSIASAAEIIGNSKISTAGGKPAIAGMPEILRC
jgi:hypothetical protein